MYRFEFILDHNRRFESPYWKIIEAARKVAPMQYNMAIDGLICSSLVADSGRRRPNDVARYRDQLIAMKPHWGTELTQLVAELEGKHAVFVFYLAGRMWVHLSQHKHGLDKMPLRTRRGGKELERAIKLSERHAKTGSIHKPATAA
jgi:hypothetical protein